jgi:hypothetical protein
MTACAGSETSLVLHRNETGRLRNVALRSRKELQARGDEVLQENAALT